MCHILIITGGYLNIDFARMYIKTLSVDKVFAVDKGLEYADILGICPDYIVGDFDSVDSEILNVYERKMMTGEFKIHLERHPSRKDATDTELAVMSAIKEGATHITLMGTMGTRLDHVMANLSLLIRTIENNIECHIVDENNRVRILQGGNSCHIAKKNQHGKYLSLIPISSTVKGITITGVMYPLYNKNVHQGSSLTVSNQIKDETAVITIKDGKMLIIESKDGK